MYVRATSKARLLRTSGMHDQLSNKLHTRVLPISEAVADVTSFLCRLPATGCTGCSGRTCHRRPLIPLSATVGVDQCSPSAPGHAWRSKSQVTSVRRSRRAVAADAWLADLCAVVCVGCDTGLRCTGGTGVCVCGNHSGFACGCCLSRNPAGVIY